MTPGEDEAAITLYHQDMTSMHGPKSSFALGWRDWNDQTVRFKAIAAIADISDCSVLDAGSGYSDLLPFLSSQFTGIKYTGLEQIPEFIDEAIKRYGGSNNTTFINGNFMSYDLPLSDYVIASGSLNYHSTDPDFIYRAITKLYAACRIGFAFNLLGHMMPDGLLVAYDSGKIMRYCGTLSPRVNLVRGYAVEDFTIHLFR